MNENELTVSFDRLCEEVDRICEKYEDYPMIVEAVEQIKWWAVEETV